MQVEFDGATARQLNVTQGLEDVSLGDMQQAINSVATELQQDTGTSLLQVRRAAPGWGRLQYRAIHITWIVLQSSVGVAAVCDNRVCEAGETASCPSDCVTLRNCPEAEGRDVAGSPGQCSGRGPCNLLQGVCNCSAAYTGDACDTCDVAGGYFWEEQQSYCRRAQVSGLVGSPDGPGVNRSSGFWGLTMVAVLCSGAISAALPAGWILGGMPQRWP